MIMQTLNEFLLEKRAAMESYGAAAIQDPKPVDLEATVEVRGRSGVRVIKIRPFELISDTAPDLAGFDLGPLSPEHQLAALGGCIAHTAEMVAATMALSLDAINVKISAQMHPLAQTPGYEHIQRAPYNLQYTLTIRSVETPDKIEALHRKVEEICPLYNLIKHPQNISGKLVVA